MKASKFTGDFRFDLLVLTTLLATGTHPLHAQGLIAFTNHGGEVAAPFTDDEGALLGYAYAAQLQTAEGTSIGPRSYFNSIGRFSGGIRSIPGIPPGESADLKIAVFGPGGQVGTSNTFSVVLGGDGKRPPGLTGLEPTTVKRYKVYDLVECAPRSEDSPTAAEARAHVTHFGEERLLVPASQLDGDYAFGDLDGDQDLDILATSLTNGYRVFLQDQTGRYQSHLGPSQSNELNQVTLGDLDGDGDLDGWFSANGTESELWLNDGSGTFTQSNANIGNNADRVTLSDLDSDGDLDAIVHAASGASSQIQSWLNDGKGHFTMEARFEAPCDSAARQFQIGDLNGDSLPDYVYVCGTSLYWRPNLGAGQFTDPVGGLNATSILSPIQIDEHPISIVDIDRDGDNDVVVPYQNLPSSLWLNNGNGEFGLSTAMIGSRDRRLSPP